MICFDGFVLIPLICGASELCEQITRSGPGSTGFSGEMSTSMVLLNFLIYWACVSTASGKLICKVNVFRYSHFQLDQKLALEPHISSINFMKALIKFVEFPYHLINTF